ncbi:MULTISPECIES: Zn-dependent alcohol dehydrogenase [Microbacteriaceae]|uniref:Alcohol dehydrogenase n=1 Tax=Gulosibacter molinativorax TaxID=256821 RepID=A0ABT7CBQ2_9MICO|nr:MULTISPECIES: Zn-dependent alcohol dehydrogenase [Microbacteriaceae]MDJ1372574.1 alcohol dehydrogenase [Gulosibacter molinativorax]MDO8383119.1 Zn-dependent alcohol dehydrogenase [Microbacterium sp.]QUY61518.1 S-(Hydroxymethyl)glutathione dehydrogenase / alcohol dehydrogenase [Gulosibacter molinativorax]
MKASVVREFGGGFHTEDVTISDPIGREVLVQVKASGLCHTDELAQSTNLGFDVPVVLGHEVAGIVTAIGDQVRDIAIGDHVVGCLVQYCGACIQCLTGNVHLCLHPESTIRDNRIIDGNGHQLNQGMGLGGFAEYAVIHENQLAKVPDALPFPQAALLGCGVVTGAGAVMNTANVQPGKTVAIIGTGGVGTNAISGAVIAGASRIIAIDVADDKLANARQFGATDTVNSREVDAVQTVKDLTGGLGADFVFDFVGAPGVTRSGFDMLAAGGGLYLIGVLDPANSIEVSSFELLGARKRIEGVYMGSTNPKRDIPMIAELYLQGRYKLDELVSKEISIDEVQEGYASLRDPKINRVVITSF